VRFFLTRVFIKISFLFLELSDFFHSLPVAVLKPADLIEITKRHYAKAYIVEGWIDNVCMGLSSAEEIFCGKYGSAGSKALVVGCGPGRESIVLARRGFEVTAIDSSLPMIEAARGKIGAAGVNVDLRLLSLYDIGGMEQRFDMIFFGVNYGMIPTRALRREALRAAKKILKPSGALYLCFSEYEPSKYAGLKYFLYKTISYIVFGNRTVEKGDLMCGPGEFHHCFDSIDDLTKEIGSAGLLVDAALEEENALFLKGGSG